MSASICVGMLTSPIIVDYHCSSARVILYIITCVFFSGGRSHYVDAFGASPAATPAGLFEMLPEAASMPTNFFVPTAGIHTSFHLDPLAFLMCSKVFIILSCCIVINVSIYSVQGLLCHMTGCISRLMYYGRRDH